MGRDTIRLTGLRVATRRHDEAPPAICHPDLAGKRATGPVDEIHQLERLGWEVDEGLTGRLADAQGPEPLHEGPVAMDDDVGRPEEEGRGTRRALLDLDAHRLQSTAQPSPRDRRRDAQRQTRPVRGIVNRSRYASTASSTQRLAL